LVERHVAGNDVVAVAFTSGRSSGQDFTASRRRLLAAVERFTGNKLRSATAATIEDLERQKQLPPEFQREAEDTYEAERALRARTSLDVLKTQADFLSGIRGRRKALVYIGEGIDYDIKDVVEPNRVTITRDARGVQEAMRDAVSAATRGNVGIYSIDPRGLSTGMEEAIRSPTILDSQGRALGSREFIDEMSRSHLSMRALSEQTGGIAFLNTNDTAAPLSRIVEDSSRFYVLGYYAPAGRKDGRFRTVDVRVRRPGLKIRSRPGYYAPRDDSPAAPPPVNSPASKELLDALRSPLPVDGLSFSVSAPAFQGQMPDASVALVVELDPSSLKFVEHGGSFNTDIELHIIAIDPSSKKARDSQFHAAALRLRPETHEAVAQRGVRITRRLELPPGRYRLQVGVRDKTSGAVGTVLTDLDVPNLFEPALAMSGLTLVSAAATRITTAYPDPDLTKVLPGPHTSTREFPTNDTLAVFAEIYDTELGTPHRVTTKTTVTAEDGTLVSSTDDERRSEEFEPNGRGERAASGTWRHTATIPVPAFGPGRYVLRVEAEIMPSGTAPTVVRELEFRVR
jgi:VWFA-related protein